MTGRPGAETHGSINGGGNGPDAGQDVPYYSNGHLPLLHPVPPDLLDLRKSGRRPLRMLVMVRGVLMRRGRTGTGQLGAILTNRTIGLKSLVVLRGMVTRDQQSLVYDTINCRFTL